MAISLPIDPLLSSIAEAMAQSENLILTATPGAGKTTRLPPELLNVVPGKIAVLQPRRMAAVAAAARIAEERGWKLGEEVGYQVRFESKITAKTRLIFMTDALFLRRMIEDPQVSEFDLIVLDEFHERGLNQDITLGCLKELQEMGRPLKILVMSATLNVEPLLRFLPGSRHIDVPGKVFPLDLRHQTEGLSLRTDFDFINRVSTSVTQALRESGGDILVFLPGVGEIHRVESRLLEMGVRENIFHLHGSLPLTEQRKILSPADQRRVILSTNVAEASVTVPGVDCVIDSGLAKVNEVSFSTGFSKLELTRIGRFNADQRAGRAARQGPGRCLRLWTSFEETTQALQLPAECERSDLTQSLLLLSFLGVTDFGSFSWLDRPPGPLIDLGVRGLKAANAIDSSRRLTDFGRELMRFPLHPRWGALLLKAEEMGLGQLGARIAALVQDRDIVPERGEIHANTECDIVYRLELLADFEKGQSRGLNVRQAAAVLESANQLEKLLNPRKAKADFSPDAVRRLLLSTQSDRLCRRRSQSERAVMRGGRGVKIDKESQVRRSEFFVAMNGMERPGQADTAITLACGVSKELVLEVLKDQITRVEDVSFNEEKGQVFARRQRRIQDLELEDPSLTPVPPGQAGELLAQALASKWDWLCEKNEPLGLWIKRWRFLGQHAPEYQETLTDAKISEVIQMAAFGKAKTQEVLDSDLVGLLESTLDATTLRALNKEAPEKFQAPSGVSHPIHYEDSLGVFVEVRLQEIFGLLATPKLAMGKVPLTFRLLGPNFRPVQVTSDLAGFWKGAYHEVRKELRIRYPKHAWPEDPYTAKPEAKGRRRT